MTPDLKRLCEAAEAAFDDNDGGSETEDGDLVSGHISPRQTEAIVRAVLTELREVVEQGPKEIVLKTPLDATQLAHIQDALSRGGNLEIGQDAPLLFTAMIDHILAEPATA